MRLVGRFLAKDRRIYQVVVIGPRRNIDAEPVDTFLTSFKLNENDRAGLKCLIDVRQRPDLTFLSLVKWLAWA
jgi:hypothetical protein